jgi:hypothetical protein
VGSRLREAPVTSAQVHGNRRNSTLKR